MAKTAPRDLTERRAIRAGTGSLERKGPTDFLDYKEGLEERGLKGQSVMQGRWAKRDPLESQVFLVTSVSLEREEWLDPEESLGASDQWATWGFRELKASREVRELWETQDFQVRPVSVEDLVRGAPPELPALRERWAWQEVMVCRERMENLVHLDQLAIKESQESVVSWALRACRGHKESWGPEGYRENMDQWASKENRACLGLQERTAYLVN
ncbi:unnamed protein product [Arctogadus glacialis]